MGKATAIRVHDGIEVERDCDAVLAVPPPLPDLLTVVNPCTL